MPVIRFRRHRPVAIVVMSLAYVGVAGTSLLEALGSNTGVTGHDYLISGLYLAVAYGLIRMRPWGWYLVVAHASFLLALHSVNALTGTGVDRWLSIQLNVVVLFVIWFVARRSVRSPFHDPAMRWWERQHPRHGVSFDVRYRIPNDPSDYQATGLNLSYGGCFIALPGDQDLVRSQRMRLTLSLNGFEPLQLDGRVAWTSGTLPGEPDKQARGAGIQFARMPAKSRRALTELLKAIAEAHEAERVKNEPIQS